MTLENIIYITILTVAACSVFLSSLAFIVAQQNILIIERLGKFHKIAQPGLHFKIPLIDVIKGELNLRIKQLDVSVETKTEDNVFVHIIASVQYRVLNHEIYKAFYTLENTEQQIQSFVFDVIRAHVPSMTLDNVFSKKDEIAKSVRSELKEIMNNFGYDIMQALITDIQPDHKVKNAMNEINEAQRLRVAALEKGEAEKIISIKKAEAESESKILQGKGIAGQRTAIMNGLKESLDEFSKRIDGVDEHATANPRDAMALLMMAQYFDTLKELGHGGNSKVILLPHSPGSMNDLLEQIRNTLISTTEIKE